MVLGDATAPAFKDETFDTVVTPWLIDIIPQHHGTRVMTYFLDKARRAPGGHAAVQEDEFRYPGPKPKTPEAAIFMLQFVFGLVWAALAYSLRARGTR